MLKADFQRQSFALTGLQSGFIIILLYYYDYNINLTNYYPFFHRLFGSRPVPAVSKFKQGASI